MKNFAYIFMLVVIAFGIYGIASAHPGRTDGSGGHTCRTNCFKWGLGYGEYHYHGLLRDELTFEQAETLIAPKIAAENAAKNAKQLEDHKANVSILYWALFNRAHENENVVEAKANKHGDIRKVAEEMLASPEFKQRNARLFK